MTLRRVISICVQTTFFLFSVNTTTELYSTMAPDSKTETIIITIALLVLFLGVVAVLTGIVLYKRMNLCNILISLHVFKLQHKMNANKQYVDIINLLGHMSSSPSRDLLLSVFIRVVFVK